MKVPPFPQKLNTEFGKSLVELVEINWQGVFGKALYARAANIKFKHRYKLDNIILRMGAFYEICTILAKIGKRF